MTKEEERRSRGQRVPFEALVVVANQKGGAGAYECEAVDVSARGMHLRTAYLPEVGQSLTFRFDGGGGEVTVEGVVQWRDEQAKGGEFGVKFSRVDEKAMATLRELCGVSEEGAPTQVQASKGARVRLHIDGLGAPMRARVRDVQTGEVMVGSNLDFLRVGNPLELEDVEQGRKRGAVVDKVECEIDPASKVPQLVVTLRYEGDAQNAAPPTLGRPSTQRPSTSDEGKKSSVKGDAKAREAKASEGAKAANGDQGEGADESAGVPLAARARQLVADVGPKLGAASEAVRTRIVELVAKVRGRRGEVADGGVDDGEAGLADEKPRRVTSPPPDGGVKARDNRGRGGREESVEQGEETNLDETDEAATRVRRKQRVIIGAAAAMLVVLLGVFALKSRGAPPGAEAAAGPSDAAAVAGALPPGNTQLGAPLPGAIGSGDAVAANVPMFGAMPLSTTEPVAAPAGSAALAAAPGAPGGDDDGPGEADEGSKGGATEFGKGEVEKPRTVRLKMDAPITEVKGSTSPNAFTVVLPGRRNVESASTLAKRDKRLSSVKAVPKDGGTEVTFTFKDGVPPFLAKANGKMLEVDLGEASKDAEASAKKGGKKKHAVAKADGEKKGKKTAHADKDKKKGKKKKAHHD